MRCFHNIQQNNFFCYDVLFLCFFAMILKYSILSYFQSLLKLRYVDIRGKEASIFSYVTRTKRAKIYEPYVSCGTFVSTFYHAPETRTIMPKLMCKNRACAQFSAYILAFRHTSYMPRNHTRSVRTHCARYAINFSR